MLNTVEGISFGFRCSSASLLTKKGIRTYSMPFDWLVSRLSVIEDGRILIYAFANEKNISTYFSGDDTRRMVKGGRVKNKGMCRV